MDLSIPLIGVLSYFGYNISEKKTKQKKNKLNDELLGREMPSSKHTFNSTFVKEAELKELEQSTLNYIKSEKPALTNVVNSSIYPFNGYDQGNSNLNEEEAQILNGPLFKQKMDYLSNKFLIEPMQGGPQLSELSGLPMEMSHNNMMPFTTIHGENRAYANDTVNSITLNKFTGNEKTTNREVPKNTAPFFKPTPQRLPNEANFTQKVDRSRFDTSKLISGVSPIPLITVGKIPQQLISTPVKNVDQLRNKNYPKLNAEGRTIPGSKLDKKSADIGEYNQKGRAPRQYEQNLRGTAVSSQIRKGDISNAITDYKIKDCKNTQTEGYTPNAIERIANYIGISDIFNFTTGFKKDAVDTADKTTRNLKIKNHVYNYNQLNLDNTYAKEQQRDTTIFNKYTAPVSKGNFGATQREYSANPNKTTNREINITSYSGITSNPINAPIDYQSFLENNRVNPRLIVNDHYNNGGRQLGTEKDDIGAVKGRILITNNDYFGNARNDEYTQVNTMTYGQVKVNNGVDNTDFSQRYQYFAPPGLNSKY